MMASATVVLPDREAGAATISPRAMRSAAMADGMTDDGLTEGVFIAAAFALACPRGLSWLSSALFRHLSTVGSTMSFERPLRRGWTTGACATAAAKAAYAGLLTGEFPDPVEVSAARAASASPSRLRTPAVTRASATAGIIKDAGDDPDVTHGATILATVRHGAPGSGVTFRAGPGVGTVTRAGPAGRARRTCHQSGAAPHDRGRYRRGGGRSGISAGDAEVEIAVPDGEALAARTLNARLGIIGGLSILGTTGIVVPYSCAAWIHSIHSGIAVARAAGIGHIAGATGSTSESAVQKLFFLPEIALIDMGDFVGGMLKFLRRHPVPRVTIAGGIAKMTKLAQGRLDLHSRRGAVDLQALARLAAAVGGSCALQERIIASNTTAEAFAHAAAEGVILGDAVAHAARDTARRVVEGFPIAVDVVVFDRDGVLAGRSR